jgi:hypothetical protein
VVKITTKCGKNRDKIEWERIDIFQSFATLKLCCIIKSLTRMNYCPRCKENDGVEVIGVKMTAKEKIADFIGGKIAEYIIIMDPPLSPPSLISLLCKTIYRC